MAPDFHCDFAFTLADLLESERQHKLQYASDPVYKAEYDRIIGAIAPQILEERSSQ